MFAIVSVKKISLTEALILVFLVLAILGFSMIFVSGMAPQIAILLAIITLLLYGLAKGVRYEDMQNSMAKAVNTSMGAIYLFFFIGVLITALMMSGAIPTLMYYGLNMMSAKTFYFSSFVICSVIGIAIGSSLTTVSTLGVALMGISAAFGANPAITAGSVVSGAFLGDKMSPLSDTTGIAASIVGVDLFDHIKNMTKTTLPAFVLASIFYIVFSFGIDVQQTSQLQAFQQDLLSTGLVHGYSLIPFVMLVAAAFFKVPAIVSMLFTSIVSVGLAFIHSTYGVAELCGFFFGGFSMPNLPDSVASLIARGGINSMFFTITIVVLALSLGGLLFALGIIGTILNCVSVHLNTAFKATLAVALTGVGINYVVGEQYLSILLTGETFKPVYAKLGLQFQNLSRALEDSGTVINPLVPWSVCGSFIASTLGISVMQYLPYAVFCYTCVALTIASGFTGKGISKTK
ncbi:MAG: Na+/H+ antiporter NhaC [Eubacteriales bacterium]|nr:Na+/H+ antiporter NhaC [Eubacteriales bacterium]